MVFKETAKNQNAVFKNGSLSNAYNNREILPMFAKKKQAEILFLTIWKKVLVILQSKTHFVFWTEQTISFPQIKTTVLQSVDLGHLFLGDGSVLFHFYRRKCAGVFLPLGVLDL